VEEELSCDVAVLESCGWRRAQLPLDELVTHAVVGQVEQLLGRHEPWSLGDRRAAHDPRLAPAADIDHGASSV
jgi:hypothetical protein